MVSCEQVQNLEAQLEDSCVKKQLEDLQRQLELLEEEKKETEGQLLQAEKKNDELQKRGETKFTTRGRRVKGHRLDVKVAE